MSKTADYHKLWSFCINSTILSSPMTCFNHFAQVLETKILFLLFPDMRFCPTIIQYWKVDHHHYIMLSHGLSHLFKFLNTIAFGQVWILTDYFYLTHTHPTNPNITNFLFQYPISNLTHSTTRYIIFKI